MTIGCISSRQMVAMTVPNTSGEACVPRTEESNMTDEENQVVAALRMQRNTTKCNEIQCCNCPCDKYRMYENACDSCDYGTVLVAADTLERVCRERDAAVSDLNKCVAGSGICRCDFCYNGNGMLCAYTYEERGDPCTKFKFRGVCADNGGAEDAKAD